MNDIKYHPITIIKPNDRSTPLLMIGISNNEHMKMTNEKQITSSSCMQKKTLYRSTYMRNHKWRAPIILQVQQVIVFVMKDLI